VASETKAQVRFLEKRTVRFLRGKLPSFFSGCPKKKRTQEKRGKEEISI